MDDRTLSLRPFQPMFHVRAARDRSVSARVLGIATGLLALFATASSWAANEKSKSLWEGEDQWVRIAPQDGSATPNDHPAQLNADEVNKALAALQIRVTDKDSGTSTQRAVFTVPEIATLAPQVVAGLGKAARNQDVVFSTIGSHAVSAGGLVKDPAVNAGRIFYQGGKLNVIFGEVQANYRKKNIYGQRSEDFTPRRQGSRDKASKQKWPLVVTPGVEFHAANGAVRNDWVEIDPASAAAAVAATPEPTAPRQAAAVPEAASASPPPSAAPAAASTSPAAAAAGAPAAAAATTQAAPAAASKSAELEKRLQALKDLKDKGLISEEAYNSKVKELLSEL
jgi:hypothetical protein